MTLELRILAFAIYIIYIYIANTLMLQKETWCIKSWGMKTFEKDEDV